MKLDESLKGILTTHLCEMSEKATPKKPPKKETKKFIQTKAYFTSPYSTEWSTVSQEDMHFILKTVKNKLISTGIQKNELNVFRQWRKGKNDSPKTLKVRNEERKDGAKNGWTDISVRRQLAIGINEVTKALERNELQLLLVCKSVKPKHMTEHLIALSASRGVPACQVPCLSVTVSEPLGLKSVLALGFKRPLEGHQQLWADVIEAISPRVPSLAVAWLQSADSSKKPQEEEEGEKRGLKRKLEVEDEPAPASFNTLQLLKVKKVVANPAKKKHR